MRLLLIESNDDLNMMRWSIHILQILWEEVLWHKYLKSSIAPKNRDEIRTDSHKSAHCKWCIGGFLLSGSFWLVHYVVWWGSKRKHRKDTCFKEIELCFHTLHSISGQLQIFMYLVKKLKKTCIPITIIFK